ncbi:MAG: hypothetical protein ACU0BS_08365 [Hasllibacter sp.]
MWRALILTLALAAPAAAGPWPREAGRGVILGSVQTGRDGAWNSAWAEYGTRLGTVALELGTRDRLAGPGDRRAALFLSRALPAPEGWALAWEAGIAVDLGGDAPRAGGRAGLALGRSVTTPAGPGWTSFALRASGAPDWHRVGLSAVLGVRATPRDTIEMRLYAEVEDGADASGTAFAIWQRELGPIRLRAGLHHGTGGPAVSLGLMREF